MFQDQASSHSHLPGQITCKCTDAAQDTHMTTTAFQNQVLTQCKYIYGIKIIWIIVTGSIKYVTCVPYKSRNATKF